jgi:hypothetical protein
VASTAFIYGPYMTSVQNKELDVDTDTWKGMLTTVTYAPNQDTHRYKSDITNEVSSANYTAGGTAVSPLTMTYTAGTNTLAVTGSNAAWTNVTFTARYFVLYDSTPATDATRPLVLYVDFGADQTVSGQNFTVVMNAAGWWTSVAT